MTYSYDLDPENIPRDAVRFLVRDTDSADPQLEDEEIAWLLSEVGGNVYEAAARGATTIAGKYARKVTKSVGDLSLSYKERVDNYTQLAKDLRAMVTRGFVTVAPFAGGISRDDKESREQDGDRVPPSFSRGMTDNPRAVPETLPPETTDPALSG